MVAQGLNRQGAGDIGVGKERDIDLAVGKLLTEGLAESDADLDVEGRITPLDSRQEIRKTSHGE